jgi:pimeloyl-ACP methyl ester carboxylesterase
MARSTAYFDVEERPASVPIWREALFGLDWLALRASPVLYGRGIPRGDGAPVVVVPGFLGSDAYLREMYCWLGRIGYRPFLSRIGRNAACLDLLLGRLLGTVEEAWASTGRPAHLIGHSLGGMLARSAAVRRPDRIASVITLGSPFRGIRSHPLVMRATSVVRARIRSQRDDRPDCFTAACQCDTVAALQGPLPSSVPQIAIYTKMDGIVDWRSCLNDEAQTDVEVSGTHVGLVWNRKVYRIIAERLARLRAPARAGAPG